MAKSSGFMQDAGLHKPRQNEIKNKCSSRKDFTYLQAFWQYKYLLPGHG